MSKPSLAIYLFGYNLNRIVYPWKASLRSALVLADRVYFCECYSTDDTLRDLRETFDAYLEQGSLVLLRHAWGKHHTVQAVIANKLLDQIGHGFDFALKLDADEVLCEWSFQDFRDDLEQMGAEGWALGRPHYTHFCPDDRTTFPFIYDAKAVISRTQANLRYALGPGGDACALGGATEFPTRLEVHHYGKMHMGRRAAALDKEVEFTKLYYDRGFPDPKVEAQRDGNPDDFDYEKVFDLAKQAGQFQPYTGRHPIFVQDWLIARRVAEASYEAQR